MDNLANKILRFAASEKFFWVVMAVFLFQALWLVFSALYPMAFDEAYHFIFIQVYAEQWSPFILEHPEHANELGIVTREASYLYHYLMSFPYRVIAWFTGDQVVQVLILRLINVGLFATALVLIRKLMLKTGISRALTNTGILLFILVPIVPLLAAHINYDNLLLLLVVWMALLVLKIEESVHTKEVPARELVLLTAVAGLASVVKQASLPILVAIAVFVAAMVWRLVRTKGIDGFWQSFKQGWLKLSLWMRVGLLAAIVLGIGLFIERSGVNMVYYGSLQPSCEQVVSFEQCMAFGPYERTVHYLERVDYEVNTDLGEHVTEWSGGMWRRTFFMINGDVPVDRYHNFPPLPLPAYAITFATISGLLAATWHWRSVFRQRPATWAFLGASAFYVFVLWYTNYTSTTYQETGRIAAANGRYLITIAPLVLVICGLGFKHLLKNRGGLKAGLMVGLVLLSLNGGGVVSFWVRSSSTWYWPNAGVQQANEAVREAVSPLIIGKD